MASVVVLCRIEQGFDSWLHKTPSAGVEWLFLTPNDRLSVLVRVEVIAELSPREGVELFDTGDGGCLAFFAERVTVFVERGVYLTSTYDDTVDILWFGDSFTMFWIGNDPLEVGVTGEF